MRRQRWVAFVASLLLAIFFAHTASAQTVDAGRGAIPLYVPPSYSALTPVPLIVLLHGYTSSGAVTEAYMQFSPLADEFGFLLIAPDGLVDCGTNPFWNATDACCHFCGGVVDDVGYLTALIDAIKAGYNVDAQRIYFMGHSNGGFMSYRMACERSHLVAGVATLAGATYFDPLDCNPSEPVHTLQIHGTADATILYGGGIISAGTVVNVSYPGAVQTTETWATFNGCSLTPDTSPPNLDLESTIVGNESTVSRYDAGCRSGGSAELWTIPAGSHVPSLSTNFSREIVLHFLAHPKPAATAVPAFDTRSLLVLGLSLAAMGFVAVVVRGQAAESI
jgi:polyhydroxybutyrate depolymerase